MKSVIVSLRRPATIALAAGPAPTASASAGDDGVRPLAIYETGDFHVLDVDYVAGALTLDIKEWSGSDDLSPATTLFRLLPSAAGTVPSGSAWSCLGPAGSTVYVAPQTQDTDLLWLGWNTVDVPAAQGPIQMELVGFEGPPGSWFTLYTVSFGTPTYLLNTNGGFGCPVSSWPGSISAGVSGYGNWAFSAPGNYTLKFRATARDGAGATSGVVTYTVHVG